MLAGELVQWNDERGFGFIAGDDGKRYFVHVSSIGRMVNRPRAGDWVSFAPGIGRDGRPAAINVKINGANPRATRAVLRRGLAPLPRKSDWRLPLALLLAISIFVATVLGRMPWEVSLAYAGMGLVSFILYSLDKNRAKTGQWRVSEVTLLGVDLCLGLIGGLLAQALLRHKTRKPGYVATTLVIALVHLLWLAGFVTGLIRIEDLQSLMSWSIALMA